MSDHYIHFEEELGMSANDRLMDIIQSIGMDDELIITIDKYDDDQSDYLFAILEKSGFEVMTKGSHDGEEYHIIAHKKRS